MRRSDGSTPLDPGSLRDILVIQRVAKTQNSYGEDVETWSDLMTLRAKVRAAQGRELESMQQTWAEARFKIRAPFPPVPIRREDKALWGTRTLDILDVEDPDGLRREIVIVAREFTQ